jgi:hypothetical protein
MTDYERYLFDLNGYLVVEDMLTEDQVHRLNEAVDHNRDHIRIRPPEQSLDGRDPQQGTDSAENLKGLHGRGEFSGFFSWPEPWCQPFRELLDLPAGLRYMIDTIGDEIRLEEAQGLTMIAGSVELGFTGWEKGGGLRWAAGRARPARIQTNLLLIANIPSVGSEVHSLRRHSSSQL